MKGPVGLEEVEAGDKCFLRLRGKLRRDEYPPHREGVYGEGKGPGWKELCVYGRSQEVISDSER